MAYNKKLLFYKSYPAWNTPNGSLATINNDSLITPIQLSATEVDEPGSTIKYTLAPGSDLPTGLSLSLNGVISGTATGYAGGVTNVTFSIVATDDEGEQITRSFSLSIQGVPGFVASNPASSAEQIRSFDPNFTSGLYYISTPDGGTQQVYCLNYNNEAWMLVGRLNSDASSTVTSNMNSQRGNIGLGQSDGNLWSADFGTYQASKMMVWGASNFTAQTGTNVNWIYGINTSSYPTFRSWICNISDSSTTSAIDMGVSNGKNGQICNGAWDGPFKGSRWSNPGYIYHRVSDTNPGTATRVKPGGFSTPLSSMFYTHGMTDAKWSVAYSANTSGQDVDGSTSQLFGFDDSFRGFFDAGTSTVNNNSTRVDSGYSTAVTFWIK